MASHQPSIAAADIGGGIAPAPLSVLDQVTTGTGTTPAEALAAATELARHAETWGYHRFWVAEHHGMPGLGSPAPAVLIAHLAAHTRRLRLGSGGVMLPNHTPLAVAEQFGLLQALHPGRIDLGIGRAPGGDQATARALRRSTADFPTEVHDLIRFLDGDFPLDHPHHKIAAIPHTDPRPPVWLLGSTSSSAALAGRLGLPYAYNHRVGREPPELALDSYRTHFRPSRQQDQPYAILAVSAVAAPDEHQARRLARTAGMAMIRLRRPVPEPAPLMTPEQAQSYPISPPEAELLDRWLTELVLGDPGRVAERLESLRQRAGAHELMITTHIHGQHARTWSYQHVAHAYGLVRRLAPMPTD